MGEIVIHGDIGWDVRSADVVARLADIEGDVTVRINSGGGDVHEGLAIMNALRAHAGEVLVVVEGLAASAASFIAVGGATRLVMRPTAELMIHEAWSMADGNAADMTKAAGDLDRISANLAGIYTDRAGGTTEQWRERMRAETWFSADEALSVGLVDAVEDARGATKPAALGRSKVMASFRYGGRRDAPAPVINGPSGQKEEGMSFLNELAQKLGKPEAQVLAALGKIMNEEVTVISTVDISYPEGTSVVPTGKATVEPVGEIPPSGLAFTVGEAPEGWVGEVDEATGVLSVTAPAGAEPESEVDLVVTVAGNDASVELPVKISVKSAAGEGDPVETGGGEPAAADSVTLDMDTYRDLQAAAKLGWQAKAAADKRARADEVDGWIREGRVNVAHRAKVIAAMERNDSAARDLYGSIPKNTIPRGEVGHAVESPESSGDADAEARVRRALTR